MNNTVKTVIGNNIENTVEQKTVKKQLVCCHVICKIQRQTSVNEG